MKSEILDKIGPKLYDPRFKIAYWEDVDLSWRVGLLGFKLAIFRQVFLHHFVNASSINLPRKYKWTE